MGSYSRFTCSPCDLTVEVSGSGEIDYGMRSASLTLVCGECRQISTASVRVPKERMYMMALQDLQCLPSCTVCKSKQVQVWKAGDPCPRCHGPLVRDPDFLCLWD